MMNLFSSQNHPRDVIGVILVRAANTTAKELAVVHVLPKQQQRSMLWYQIMLVKMIMIMCIAVFQSSCSFTILEEIGLALRNIFPAWLVTAHLKTLAIKFVAILRSKYLEMSCIVFYEDYKESTGSGKKSIKTLLLLYLKKNTIELFL